MQSKDFEILSSSDELTLCTPVTPAARQQILSFVRSQFLAHFGADVDDDAPTLVGGFDASGVLIAAFGLRRSADGFFCERYLGDTVPKVLAERYQRPVSGVEVVEVVHLCAVRPGFLALLMPLLARTLERSGFHFLVCTATGCLSSFFTRKGLPAVHLAAANPLCLDPAERERWGRYYDKRPHVIAGDLTVASGMLRRVPAATLELRPTVAALAMGV